MRRDPQESERAGELREGRTEPEGTAVPDRAVVFLHIPKCGGTSLHDWMADVLAPGLLCPERNRMPAELTPSRLAELRRYRVFAGHFDVVDAANMPQPQRRFMVVRDPIDRIVSLYDYWRAHDPEHVERHDLVGPRIAAATTFDEFVGDLDRRIAPDLDNTMVRTLTGLIRTTDPISDPETGALARAVEAGRALDHVGHVDRLAETVAWLRSAFGLPPSEQLDVRRRNVGNRWDEPYLRNDRPTVPTPGALASMEPLVRLDRELLTRICG